MIQVNSSVSVVVQGKMTLEFSSPAEVKELYDNFIGKELNGPGIQLRSALSRLYDDMETPE